MSERSVFLVGMMAVGKTTIGRHVATRLGFDFFDADSLVEARAGADISWIFDVEGEAGFRDREQRAIEELTAHPRAVVATGGGAVLRASNRRRLSERGLVVYLKAAVDVVVERARRNRRRPLLQGGDMRQRVADLCREREPLYRSVAHIEVVTDRRPPREVAAEIADEVLARNSP